MATAAEDMEPQHAGCLNCGSALTGAHCHGCGQPAHVHRSVAAIGHDLLHGVLHLDGKLAHTLPLLAIKPGQLTRRYTAGERRRFVSPMGMFLFSITVLFLAMQVFGVHPFEIGEADLAGPALARAEASLAEVAHGRGSADDDQFGVHQTQEADGATGVMVGIKPKSPVPAEATVDADDAAKDRQEALDQVARARAALPLVRQAQTAWGYEGVKIDGGTTGSLAIDGAIQKAVKDPALVAYKVQANSYKFSWALIPLSVPFVWLLFFWRRDVGLYDHTVFVTYSLATVTLLTVIAMVLVKIGLPTEVAAGAVFLLAPVHIWTHLRGSYGLSKRGTLWRFLLLSLFIWFALALFAVILLVLGAVG